jgi:SGNH hydrolase-like domain, acetyltransferase AlgX
MIHYAHRCAAAVFLLALWLPLSQQWGGWMDCIELGGVERTKAVEDLTFERWFAGDYQRDVDGWYERHVGFRGRIIRTDNQIRLSLFGDLKGEVLLGKSDWLFSRAYLPSFCRTDAKRTRQIENRVRRIRALHAALRNRGVGMGVLITPIKTRLYREFLPDREAGAATGDAKTMYSVAKALLARSGVPVWDFSARAAKWKKTAEFPLFPAGGMHWSERVGKRAGIELLDEISKELGRKFNKLELLPATDLAKPTSMDSDLAWMSNVWDLERIEGKSQSHEVVLHPGENGERARILIVGGSFMWSPTHALELACDRLTTYYYFNSRFEHVGEDKDIQGEPIRFTDQELSKQILDYDYVIIECNELVPNEMGSGFLHAALTAFRVGARIAADRERISVGRDGQQDLTMTISAGLEHADRQFLVVGSMTGTKPGFDLRGFTVPLRWDSYTKVSLAAANTPMFASFRGRLGGDGRATATLRVAGLAGLSFPAHDLWHVVLVLDELGNPIAASNAVRTTVTR